MRLLGMTLREIPKRKCASGTKCLISPPPTNSFVGAGHNLADCTAPQVNSPGPDAGAYWLERRQSYRVKMTDPALSHHIGQHQQSKPTATQRGMKKGARKTRSVTKARARMSSPGREASLLTTGTGITKQEEGVQSSPGEKATRMRMQKGDNATHGVGDPGGGLGQRHRCSPGDRRRGSSGGVDRGMHNSRLRETHPSAIVENG